MSIKLKEPFDRYVNWTYSVSITLFIFHSKSPFRPIKCYVSGLVKTSMDCCVIVPFFGFIHVSGRFLPAFPPTSSLDNDTRNGVETSGEVKGTRG